MEHAKTTAIFETSRPKEYEAIYQGKRGNS
jgi:hypothetical protein